MLYYKINFLGELIRKTEIEELKIQFSSPVKETIPNSQKKSYENQGIFIK